MTTSKQRFPWLSLLVGLILGAAGGLAYAWYLNPVDLIDISPHQLSTVDQQAYILLISEAYLQDQDLERAQTRLETLRLREPGAIVAAQADSAFASGGDPRAIRALTALAQGLGVQPASAAVFSGTVQPTAPAQAATITATFAGIESPTPTSDILPTETPLPFPSLTPTVPILLETNLELIALETICDGSRPPGFIEVYVNDAEEQGIPAIKVLVQWEGQQDTFFTGLKLERDPGYADFQMEPNTLYTVTLVELTEPVVGLDSSPCTSPDGESLLPTYQLIFAPPEEEEESEP